LGNTLRENNSQLLKKKEHGDHQDY
jgi:hypothetical protein